MPQAAGAEEPRGAGGGHRVRSAGCAKELTALPLLFFCCLFSIFFFIVVAHLLRFHFISFLVLFLLYFLKHIFHGFEFSSLIFHLPLLFNYFIFFCFNLISNSLNV